jgi:hypothetical protein
VASVKEAGRRALESPRRDRARRLQPGPARSKNLQTPPQQRAADADKGSSSLVRSHVASTVATVSSPTSNSAAASRMPHVPFDPKGQRIPAQGATLGNGSWACMRGMGWRVCMRSEGAPHRSGAGDRSGAAG